MTLKTSLPVMAERALKQNQDAYVQPHHVDCSNVDGMSVELHFTPSIVFNPFYKARVQEYFQKCFARCENHRLPVDVDVVFQLMHLRRHLISEGIGLRQVIDLYMTLRELQKRGDSTAGSCPSVENVEISIREHGLGSFARAMMWVLKEAFNASDELLICKSDEKRGHFVLNEILKGGNFGKYNKDKGELGKNHWQHMWYYSRLAMKCVRYFPNEALWNPFYRVYIGLWK